MGVPRDQECRPLILEFGYLTKNLLSFVLQKAKFWFPIPLNREVMEDAHLSIYKWREGFVCINGKKLSCSDIGHVVSPICGVTLNHFHPFHYFDLSQWNAPLPPL